VDSPSPGSGSGGLPAGIFKGKIHPERIPYDMSPTQEDRNEIRRLLQTFQDGYTRRKVEDVDAFMELFLEDAEVIGTNGLGPGVEEWYTSRETARQLVQGDWESWGDVRLDVAGASIRAHGEVGWIAASGTVSQVIDASNYDSYLEYVTEFIEKSSLSAEEKLRYILRGGTNTLYELSRGENFVWPIRFTAVVQRQPDGWKFAQMTFSFPTLYFPDARLVEGQSYTAF
jgi:hypothetical protein